MYLSVSRATEPRQSEVRIRRSFSALCFSASSGGSCTDETSDTPFAVAQALTSWRMRQHLFTRRRTLSSHTNGERGLMRNMLMRSWPPSEEGGKFARVFGQDRETILEMLETLSKQVCLALL